MKKISTMLIWRSGESHFLLEQVNIQKSAYQSMLKVFTCLSGTAEDVLSRLPIKIPPFDQTQLNVVLKKGEIVQVASVRVNDDFWDEYVEPDHMYQDSKKQDILNRIREPDNIGISFSMDTEDFLIMSSVVREQLDSCDDPSDYFQIKSIADRLDQTIDEYFGDTPKQSENEDELEP